MLIVDYSQLGNQGPVYHGVMDLSSVWSSRSLILLARFVDLTEEEKTEIIARTSQRLAEA